MRLLGQFALDGGIQPHVWLEAQWRLESNAPLPNGDNGTRDLLSGILALGFDDRVEAGLSWGGANVNPDHSDGGSGAGDLEVYAKVLLTKTPLDFSVGGLVKVPSADSGKLLGSGSPDYEAFAAARKDFGAIQAIGHAGVRWNGDPDLEGTTGETSFLTGGGVIFELNRRCFGSLELNYETRRYAGLHADLRMIPGLMVRLGERGFFRAGAGVGLTAGAPDWETVVGVGWAY